MLPPSSGPHFLRWVQHPIGFTPANPRPHAAHPPPRQTARHGSTLCTRSAWSQTIIPPSLWHDAPAALPPASAPVRCRRRRCHCPKCRAIGPKGGAGRLRLPRGRHRRLGGLGVAATTPPVMGWQIPKGGGICVRVLGGRPPLTLAGVVVAVIPLPFVWRGQSHPPGMTAGRMTDPCRLGWSSWRGGGGGGTPTAAPSGDGMPCAVDRR